ncbi:ABC transporter substrate-binding protein [Aquibacillus koreensis]|uniref:ABC transporter substrate-binding protein n=1 Tax=Aquibacillus koreensis TaxID=279446 RepID=A0A9X4AJ77_9BACI|nr:ABC transporter substrate-binding protein [Aquibacillus koreensis]MCT2536750.1 ABC transporter substrate-binding protein [Aquibacillus koreensis]MDC3421494.1 ABC transporter substrate-binding protein [Aquibacillus koreensis]
MNRLMTVLFISLILLAGCGNNQSTPANENESKTENQTEVVQMKMASWSKQIAEQSNLYVAEDKGWFEEAGIAFEYIPGAGGGDAVKNIVAGNADIAFANVEAVLLAAEKGEKLKIIYNIYPDNVFNVVSLKDSGIETVEDLKGKDIGVYSFTSGTYQNLQVLLSSAGLTDEDVNVIETGVLNFGPLMNNQVAATAATDTGLYDAQQKGLGEVNLFEVKDVLNTPSDVFVVTEETFNEKKEALVKFLQVYRDSVKYVMENPEEAAKVAVDTAIDGQDEERNVEIIKIRNATSMNEEMKEKGLGWLNVDLLNEVEQTYIDMGLLQGPVGIEEMVTNELVEELN